MGELDTAGFATSPGMDLRFDDDDIGFEALCGFASFFFGEGDFAARSGDAVTGEYSFSLVLVNLHLVSVLGATAKRDTSVRIFRLLRHRSLTGTGRGSKKARMLGSCRFLMGLFEEISLGR